MMPDPGVTPDGMEKVAHVVDVNASPRLAAYAFR